MQRLIACLLVLGLGIFLGRLPARPLSAASSEDVQNLQEIEVRQQTFVEAARETCEHRPDDFLAVSRLALLLSSLRETQQRQEREYGLRIPDPVCLPELWTVIDHCRRLARTEAQLDLVRGLEARTRRQDLVADSRG